MAKFYDTLLGEYIKNPGIKGLSLDKLALRDLSFKMISYEEVTEKKSLNFKDVDLEKAAIYSGEDVYITNLLYEKQQKEKITENKILNEIEIPLTEVLKQIEIDGVFIDRDRLKGIGLLLDNEIKNLKNKIFSEIGEEFNINSPKQVGELLFEKLNLQKGKKNKTGFSVSIEVLTDLAKDNPIVQDILDYRHFSKIKSTYVDGLIDLLDKNDFLHTSYNTFVTTTGRLSSTNPNLQNIPTGSGLAGEIRDAFISRWEDGKIISFDYSQVEIRILAIMSEDENLLKAFQEGLDIHERTAKFIFGEKEITSEERKIAKAVNFGVIYGISPFGLSKMIQIPVKDASIYIDKFFSSYKKVKEFLDNIIKEAEKNEYVESIFGRRRYISGINDVNKLIKKSAEREAINMPIQGTSADIIKIAMIKIFEFLKQNKLKSKLIMQVHDELVFDTLAGEDNILKKEVKNIMENIFINKYIKLKVDIGEGKSWKH